MLGSVCGGWVGEFFKAETACAKAMLLRGLFKEGRGSQCEGEGKAVGEGTTQFKRCLRARALSALFSHKQTPNTSFTLRVLLTASH